MSTSAQLEAVVEKIGWSLDNENGTYLGERVRFAQTVLGVVDEYVQNLEGATPTEQATVDQLVKDAQQREEHGRDILQGLVSEVRGALDGTTEAQRREFLRMFLRKMNREALGERSEDEANYFALLSDKLV